MSKKSFKGVNPALQFITGPQGEEDAYDAQNTQNAQDTQHTLNAQKAYATQDTQDTMQKKRRQKLPRINMAFSEENLAYLQIISRLEGISMTAYVNRLLDTDRDVRGALVEQAQALLK